MQQKPEASTPLYEVTLSHSLTVPKDVRGQGNTAKENWTKSHTRILSYSATNELCEFEEVT